MKITSIGGGAGARGYGQPGFKPPTYKPPSYAAYAVANPSLNTGSAAAASQGYTTGGPPHPGDAGYTAYANRPTVIIDQGGSTQGAGGSGQADQNAQTYADAAKAAQQNLTADPILKQIQAIGTRSLQDAASGANALRKQLLIALGSPDLARQQTFDTVTGNDLTDASQPVFSQTTGDEQTAQAAAANPYSTLAQLLHGHQQNVGNINAGDNAANLFYSSTRAGHLGQEAQGYLQSQHDAQANTAAQLAQLAQQLLSARDTAIQNAIAAEQDAYNRALQTAVQNGGGGGSSSGGSGGDTGGGDTGDGGPPQTPRTLLQSPAAAYALNLPGTPLLQARQRAGRGAILQG